MINYETVLSTFDDKLTLMQWLQKVEAALEGAGLERVDITQITPTTAVFKFTFADGTSVTTPSITLPRGPKGDTGATGATGATGNGIASISKTGTSGLVDTYTILYTNGNSQTFNVTNGAQGEAGADGADGADGVGVSSMAIASNTGVVTVTYTDGNSDTIGNVYYVVGINGSSGTITNPETRLKLGHRNTYIDPVGKPLMYYVTFDATNYYYRSIEIDKNSKNITQADFVCNQTTGAWTYTTFTVPYMVDAEERITSLSGDTPVTSGKVLTADGNGYCSWETPSGGTTLYRHNISFSNSTTYVRLDIISNSNTAFTSFNDLKTYLENKTYTSSNNQLLVNGIFNFDGVLYNAYGMIKSATNILLYGFNINDASFNYGTAKIVSSATITDFVVAL